MDASLSNSAVTACNVKESWAQLSQHVRGLDTGMTPQRALRVAHGLVNLMTKEFGVKGFAEQALQELITANREMTTVSAQVRDVRLAAVLDAFCSSARPFFIQTHLEELPAARLESIKTKLNEVTALLSSEEPVARTQGAGSVVDEVFCIPSRDFVYRSEKPVASRTGQILNHSCMASPKALIAIYESDTEPRVQLAIVQRLVVGMEIDGFYGLRDANKVPQFLNQVRSTTKSAEILQFLAERWPNPEAPKKAV